MHLFSLNCFISPMWVFVTKCINATSQANFFSDDLQIMASEQGKKRCGKSLSLVHGQKKPSAKSYFGIFRCLALELRGVAMRVCHEMERSHNNIVLAFLLYNLLLLQLKKNVCVKEREKL